MSLHPTDGARFLLERESVADNGERATYRGSVYTADARYDYAVPLIMGEVPALAATGEHAPPALETKLATIARLIARDANSKRAEGLPPWPARVLRWRGPR